MKDVHLNSLSRPILGLSEGSPVAVSKPQQSVLYLQGYRESPKGI